MSRDRVPKSRIYWVYRSIHFSLVMIFFRYSRNSGSSNAIQREKKPNVTRSIDSITSSALCLKIIIEIETNRDFDRLLTTSLKIAFYSFFVCLTSHARLCVFDFSTANYGTGSSGSVANRLSLTRPTDDCIREANGNFAQICIRKAFREFAQWGNILIGC